MPQKGLAPILIVILIALAVGGYLIYSGKILIFRSQKTVPYDIYKTDRSNPTPTTNDETANPDSIGANWKTYTDTRYGFSVKYPETWIYNIYKVNSSMVSFGSSDSKKDSEGNMVSPEITFEMDSVPDFNFDNKSLEDYAKQKGAFGKPTSIKDVDLGSLKVKEIHHNTCLTNINCITVVFINKGTLFMVHANEDLGAENDKQLGMIYQILSTFKFTP